MIHEDGLEVYLKPKGVDTDDRKFREVPQLPDDIHHRRSVVLEAKGALKVVVKFSDTFDMHGASALHAIISTKTSHGKASSCPFITRHARVNCGFTTYSGDEKRHLRFAGWTNNQQGSYNYSGPAAAGTVTVFLTRGNPQWKDGARR